MSSPFRSAGFDKDLAALRAIVAQPVNSSEELGANLVQIYETLFNIDFSKYDVQHVTGTAREMLQGLFELRLRLRYQIADWKARGLMSADVVAALRDVFRIARYGADIFGELAIGHARLGEDEEAFKGFTGPHLNTLTHPAFGTGGELAFQSGDVILVRGMFHNSAAIARMGDVDSQFSHVCMVYVDDMGKRWVVEALISDGAVINPLDEAMRHGIGRAILFRHRDTVLAKRAADTIHAFVQKSRSGETPHIPYDFTMRLKGRKTLFCSKLIWLAFDMASDGRIQLPSFPTNLRMKNRDFVDRIGVKAKKTFAPGDLELEPDFDMVAEWRDYRVTSTMRSQDMVMTKMLEWMELHNYKFKEDFFIKLISRLGRLSSYLSETAKNLVASVVPKVPSNMERKTVAAVTMLHKTAEGIHEQVVEMEEATIKETGHQMHPRDMLAEIEKIREASGREIGYLVKSRW